MESSVDHERTMNCPECHKPLDVVIDDGAEVRACPVCKGAWVSFEIGRLAAREYIKTGGAEYEKLRITERGLDELRSKILQETTRLDIRINSAYRNARLWSLIGF